MRDSSGQQGYTLMEALIVVAIIGMVSIVTVPAFMTYMRSAKIKSSARQFAVDLRDARQRAVSQYHPTKIAIKTGAGQKGYFVADGEYDTASAGGIKWTTVPNSTKEMEETVYFSASTLVDGEDADDYIDVMFLPNGTIVNGTTSTGTSKPLPTTATITIKTDQDVPKDNYVVDLSTAGRIRLQ